MGDAYDALVAYRDGAALDPNNKTLKKGVLVRFLPRSFLAPSE